MSPPADDHPCHLQAAAGRVEACPESGCPFWVDEECVVAGLRPDYEHDPDLVQLLLLLRTRLAGGQGRGWAPLRLLPAERRR